MTDQAVLIAAICVERLQAQHQFPCAVLCRQDQVHGRADLIAQGRDLSGVPCEHVVGLVPQKDGDADAVGDRFRRVVEIPQLRGEFLPALPVKTGDPCGGDAGAQGVPDGKPGGLQLVRIGDESVVGGGDLRSDVPGGGLQL